MVFPPLGMLYVASVLEKNNYNVKLIDLRDDFNLKRIPKADIYGVAGHVTEVKELREIGEYLKGKGMSIIGGAHATHMPHDFKGYYDTILRGDGEISILPVIENRLNGVINGETVKEIDKIPFPARHLLPKERIVSRDAIGGHGYSDYAPRATIMITSRGCPFKCAFCSNIRQPIRFHSPSYVREEITHLYKKYNIHNFNFMDDHFTISKKRLKALNDEMADMSFGFKCMGRPDSIDDETARILCELGCREMQIGVESADEKVLKLMNKKISIEQTKKAIRILKYYGIKVKIFLIAGLPGETWESIELTKQFIIDTQPAKCPPTLFMPFPNCDIWKNPEKYGVRIITKDYSKYFMRHPTKSVIETDECSSKELTEHFIDLSNFVDSNIWREKNV